MTSSKEQTTPSARHTQVFWGLVDKQGPVVDPELGKCWLWVGYRWKRGYGQVPFGRDRYAHRVSYRLLVGSIPEGKLVRHLCNNPPCVNPAHLAVGTMLDNYQDMIKAGTDPRGERGGTAKHSNAKVAEVRRLFASGVRQCDISRRLDIHPAVVSDIVLGKKRRHG